MQGWLAARAIDPHRTNSRLLKKALRLRTTDNVQTALAVNAATVTDRYWFKPEGSRAVYEDIRFKENYFEHGVSFRFRQTGARFIKDNKMYRVLRKFQHSQAERANIDYIFPI